MPDKVYVRQNDTLPYLDYTLVRDSDNTPHNLTGATVKFTMAHKKTKEKKINEATVTIINATLGRVRYAWSVTDTNFVDEYEGEFEVTFSDSKILTFPENGYIQIEIIRELG